MSDTVFVSELILIILCVLAVLFLVISLLINKKYQAELKNNLKVAHKSNQVKTKFLSDLSHDIRTPLNAIIGFSNLIEKEIEENSKNQTLDLEKINEYLQKIKTSADYLLSVTNEVIEAEVEDELGGLLNEKSKKSGEKINSKQKQNLQNHKFYGKRILLAEDNDLNSEIASEVLKGEGFVVERARDGRECVDMLEISSENYYDIVLMDIEMPTMNGYAATKLIKSLPDKKKASIPVIAMTANAFGEDREKGMEAGMCEHLTKPINVHQLREVLAKVLL